MIETYLRPKLQPVCNMLGRCLLWFYCTPYMLTTAAFIAGLACGVAIILHYFYIACALLLLSGLCDMLDGTVARLSNTAHPKGAYIDLISDRMVESIFICSLAVAYPQHYYLYLMFFVALLLHFSTFIAAGALFDNTGAKSMHYDASFIERAEAFMAFALVLIFPAYIPYILLVLNIGIFCSASARFMRVIRYN